MDEWVNLSTFRDIASEDEFSILETIQNFRFIILILGTSGNASAGLDTITIPTSAIVHVSNQFCKVHHHYGIEDWASEVQMGFISNTEFKVLVANNKTDYKVALSIYGYMRK